MLGEKRPANRRIEQADAELHLVALELDREYEGLWNDREIHAGALAQALGHAVDRDHPGVLEHLNLQGDASELERGFVTARETGRVVPKRGPRVDVGHDGAAGQRDVETRIDFFRVARPGDRRGQQDPNQRSDACSAHGPNTRRQPTERYNNSCVANCRS